ncbi:succinate dehydrogenase cytochrome b subunit [candidate division KSB1 bacterium]
MTTLSSTLWSSVGKKFISGFTGLIWTGFITVHLLGNLMLFSSDSSHFNSYAEFLIGTGELLYFFEAALILTLLFHMLAGFSVWLSKLRSRPVKYHVSGNAGGNSRKTISSVTMIFTGFVVIVFLVLHISNFKYGVGSEIEEDLYQRVYDAFSNPVYTFTYVLALVLLGFHLRHGFWSAFQSLGVSHPRYSPFIYGLGITIALVLAAGFVAIPLYIFFTGGA